ncbi:MAG TPA: peptidylprolyl isomerase [Longimicrobiales bacterium]|nr:peptidylprolyl isomerase [Longimicrobiales bacterium]
MPSLRPDRAALAVVLLLCACSARTPAPPAAVVEPPVALSNADIVAIAELLRMEDGRTLDTLLVMHQLASEQREVRARAARAAGRIGNTRATPLLLAALLDPSPHVQASAAFALGELADSSAAVLHALGAVALAGPAAPAVEAVGALGRIAAPAARMYIDSLLARERLPAAVRHEALIVAWRLPRDSATRAHLVRWTRSADAELRWRAAYSLARTGGPPAVAPLLDVVADSDDRVRAQAVRGLRAALADSAGMRERALDALIAATADRHAHVRINAIAQLAAYRAPAQTTASLAARLDDADGNVRIAAAQALGQSGDVGAASALRAAAESVAAAGVRGAALVALARVDTAAAVSVATQWADSPDWVLRMYAARVLAAAPWALAGASLLRLARDEHQLVSADALNSIRAGDSLPQTRLIFIERLGARHVLVRAAAARGLARYATVADLDLLLQAYDHARLDDSPEAALAVIRALSRLRRAAVPVERTFFARFGNAPPTDAGVHQLIRDSIGAPPSSWMAPVRRGPQTQPLYFYLYIVNRYVVPGLAAGDGGNPRVVITTPHGDIELELAAADAPLTVHNFLSLIERGYYVNTRWHRVVPNFVIQDGDPRGDGSGGPGHRIRDEINALRYTRGALGMALSGPDTGGGQWFITHSPQPHLDGGYTVFGRVAAGMDAVDRVVQEEPILGMRRIR